MPRPTVTVAYSVQAVFRVAEKFCWMLTDEIGLEDRAEVVRINAERNEDYCASHDFCDANVVMLKSFRSALGATMDQSNQAHTDIVNDAWSLAKDYGFDGAKLNATCGPKQLAERFATK